MLWGSDPRHLFLSYSVLLTSTIHMWLIIYSFIVTLISGMLILLISAWLWGGFLHLFFFFFLILWYSIRLRRAPSRRGLFYVRSFCNVLIPHDPFHWRSFWWNKFHLRGEFFSLVGFVREDPHCEYLKEATSHSGRLMLYVQEKWENCRSPFTPMRDY